MNRPVNGHASNPHGIKAHPASGHRSAFQAWLADLKVTDELGQPVWITPHQLRHTFGTRMINRDVPEHIVEQLLDHTSPDMTAHYANPRKLHQMHAPNTSFGELAVWSEL